MRRPISKGYTVEQSLRNLGKDYTIISDILVTLKGGMFRISHLVVSRWGVFLIDQRNEKGAVHGTTDQMEWQVTGLGSSEAIYNPLWRAREAANELQIQLVSIPITTLIVFIHARLKNDFGRDVIYLRNLSSRIKQETKVVLDDVQINMVQDRLGRK